MWSGRERGEIRLLPRFLVSASQRMDWPLAETVGTMAGERPWMVLVWWISNVFLHLTNQCFLPKWPMQCNELFIHNYRVHIFEKQSIIHCEWGGSLVQVHCEDEGGLFSLLEAMECPCVCLNLLGDDAKCLCPRAPALTVLLPLPLNIVWLAVRQKALSVSCSGDERARCFTGGKKIPKHWLQKRWVSETFLSWMWLYFWSVIGVVWKQ